MSKSTYEELEQILKELEKEKSKKKSAEKGIPDHELFFRSFLNSLTNNVAILDEKGTILYTNEAWNTFAVSNGLRSDMTGENYLRVCDTAHGLFSDEAVTAAEGIRKVIAGEMKEFTLEYPCHSPDEKQWFFMRVTPVTVDDVIRVAVIHESITKRKLAEESLREATIIINNSPIVAFTWRNEEKWPVEYVSENVKKIFGYSEEDFRSGKICYADCVHPDDLARVIEEVEYFSNEEGITEFKHKQYRIKTKDGEIKIVSDWTFIVRNEEGEITHYKGIIQDITENRKAEDRLRYYAELLENVSDAVISTDLDFNVKSWNKAAESIYGWKKDEVTGKGIAEITGLEYPYDKQEDIVKQFLDEGYWKGEVIQKHKNGSVIDVLSSVSLIKDGAGNPVGAVAVNRDITERKKRERKLHEYRREIECSEDMIVAVDKDGNYLFVNETFLKKRNLNFDEVIGHHVGEIMGREIFEKTIKPNLVKCLNGESVKYDMLLEYTEEGKRYVNVSYYPLKDKEEITGVVGIIRDITDRKKAEERIKHLNRILLAIRNVSQLISREKNRECLIRSACENLIESRGYHKAWIALFDENGNLNSAAEAGLGDDFRQITKQMNRDGLTACGKKALSQSGVVVIRDPASSCPDCPLVTYYEGRARMSVRLEHGGKIYGLLMVSIPPDYAVDEEEQELFEEVAGDIAFALHNLESEEHLHRLERIINTIPQPMSFISRDYRYLAVNDVYSIFYNTPRERILGCTPADFFGEKVFKTTIKPHFDRCMEGISVKHEVRLHFPGLGERWIEMNCFPYRNEKDKITGIVSHWIDITERKKAEKEIREKEHLNKVLMDSLPHPAMLINKNRRVLAANQIALDVGAKIGDYCWKEFGKMEYLSEKNRKKAEKNPDAVGIKCTFCRADEALHSQRETNDPEVYAFDRIWDTYWTPLDDNVYLHYAIDITERKKLEEQLQIRQRMDSLGMLAGGIAHDFNNLLVGIMGNIDMLNLESNNFTGMQRECLKHAMSSCERAASLIGKFQLLSRGFLGKKEPVDVYDIAKEVFGILQETTDRLIKKKIEFKKGEYFVKAGASELNQVFMNLGTNAVSAIEEKGVRRGDYISIAAEDCSISGNEKTRLPEGEYVHITFKDTGMGMSDEVKRKAFDPLFTTKQKGSQKGQGLGLAMVYNIITQSHDGHIVIESSEGKGTTFHIYLPKAPSVTQTEVEDSTKITGGNETILIIEDEEIVLNLAKSVLEKYGYTVLAAENGQKGLDTYIRNRESIDLVILDLTMPELSGEAFFEEILKLDNNVKVIISSGHSKEETHRGILSLAKGHVKKPYKMKDLMNTIRIVLDS